MLTRTNSFAGSMGHDVLGKVLRGNPVIKEPQPQIEHKESVPVVKSSVSMLSGITREPKTLYSKTSADISLVKTTQTPMVTPKVQTSSSKKMSKHHMLSEEEEMNLQLTIQEDIMAEIRTGKYKLEIAPSDLIDFGGQRSYDMTHQLFIRQKGSFAVMFDGRFNLDEILKEYPEDSQMTTRSKFVI